MEAESMSSAGVTANGCVDKKPSPCKGASPSLCSIITPWAWFRPEQLDPRVAALIYWRDMVRSGVCLAVSLSVLVSLSFCSLVSVVSYFALLTLLASAGFRVYTAVKQAINKTQEPHPFTDLMGLDLALSSEKVHCAADCFLSQFNTAVSYLQRVFLIQDIVESVKFGAYLYALTYVGGWMNGLTIIVLLVIGMFSLPKAYEVNKAQVDQYLGMAQEQVKMVVDKVKAVIPMGGSAAPEQKKDQ